MRYVVMNLAAVAALAAVAVAPLLSTDPPALTVAGKTDYVNPTLVRLRAQGVAPKGSVIWRVTPRKGVHRASTAPQVLEFAAGDGTYEVDLLELATVDGEARIRETTITVKIGPAPGPAPIPPKPPGKGVLDPAKATCRIAFGTSGCTATICGPQRADGRWDVLTASHCTGGVGARGKLFVGKGAPTAVEVVGRWERPDLTWMVATITADPVPYAMLSPVVPPLGSKVWHCGYGVDMPGNTEHGTLTGPEASNGRLSFNLSVSSGDSGSGIFLADGGLLCGVVCCTTGRGRAITLHGGSSVQAASLRPVGAPVGGLIPVPVPILPEIPLPR